MATNRKVADSNSKLVPRRIHAQGIAPAHGGTPQDVLRWLGAVQAQEFSSCRWAVGLRLRAAATDDLIHSAISDGSILRTHAMRGTWQLIAAEDLRWVLSLVAERVLASCARRYRELGLDAPTLRRSNSALVRALNDRGHLTRSELAEVLEGARVSTEGQRLSHLLIHAELSALICSGERRGAHTTWAPLDERAPANPFEEDRDAALAELARRYFFSRGPATLDDFVWWSGLTVAEARAGLQAIAPELVSVDVDDRKYWSSPETIQNQKPSTVLLPAFDEYLVGYRNRDAMLRTEDRTRINAGGGMLSPSVVVDGRIEGTWRRKITRHHVEVTVEPFEPQSARWRKSVELAAARFAAFHGLEAKCLIVDASPTKKRAPRA